MPAKSGERKDQILQVLAGMLESPRPEKITTAALAAKLDVSEAALYRHFASKAQMFEGLIEFIEKNAVQPYQQAHCGREKRPKRPRAGRRHCVAIARFREEKSGHDAGTDWRCAG
jgi:AcrR family transcriptional regulator